MVNKWMTHVKKTMKKMSSKKKSMGKGWFKSVLKEAKHTYHKKGGADEVPEASTAVEEKTEELPSSEGGRRRRKTHRKRRHH